ncbi:MAG: FAD-dependent oxidoreductase [Cyanobacteria bacterium J06623_7]
MTSSSDLLSSNKGTPEKTACIIVGGGLTGLITATILQRKGISATVLDKGRGIGGRTATRRVSHENSTEGVFDYGTQYFSAKSSKFQVWIDDWLENNVIKEWSRGFGITDGKPRYCGVNGTRGIAQYLAQDLDVRTGCKVVKVNYDKQWTVETENGEQYLSEMLLLTPPVPQSLDLLDVSLIVLPLDVRFILESITYASSIAVLALLEQPSAIPAPGGLALEEQELVWLGDNHQKGISPNGYAVTLQSSSDFSEYYWDSDDAEIAYKLLTAAADYLGSAVIKYQVHRWRYSQPRTCHSQPNLALSEIPLILAGDGFVSPKIEGAVLSGIATGELISKRFKG